MNINTKRHFVRNSLFSAAIFASWFAILLFCSIVLAGCKKDYISIKAYYYPEKALEQGLVYEYRSLNDSVNNLPYYWNYKYVITDTAKFLTGQYYDNNYLPMQLSSEEIVDNGALMMQYFINSVDSTGGLHPISVNIKANNVFPFNVKDSLGIFLYHVDWKNYPDSTSTTEVIRNRRFLGFQKTTIFGKAYDCVVFGIKEEINSIADGTLSTSVEGVEYYAKDKGLVYSKKVIGDKIIKEYGLYATYPLDSLIKKANM
ncbi:MAG: hypothetical protein KA010_03220 [Saprospiraceae bacterium]|nr:hypothetical protein [Saprospiraceae bacterium]